MSSKIEPKIKCGCCGGSGRYDPLNGPSEPCDTCKGEGVIDNPALAVFEKARNAPSDEVPKMIFESTPMEKADNMRRLFEMNIKEGTGKVVSELWRQRANEAVSTIAALTEAQHREVHEWPKIEPAVNIPGVFISENMTVREAARNKMRRSRLALRQTICTLSKVQQFEYTRDYAIALEQYNDAKTQTFAEAYGGVNWQSIRKDSLLDIRFKKEQPAIYSFSIPPYDAGDFGEVLPYNAFYDAKLGESWDGFKVQSESRIHRKGMESGDIKIKLSIPPDLQDSMKKVESLMRGLVVQLQDLGIKVEAAEGSVGKLVSAFDGAAQWTQAVRNDPFASYYAAYAAADAMATRKMFDRAGEGKTVDLKCRPKFHVMDEIIEEPRVFDESSLNFPAFHPEVLAKIREKMELMQCRRDIDLAKAVFSPGDPIYLDPETGAISRQP